MFQSTLFNHHQQIIKHEVEFNQPKFFWSWFIDNANYLKQKLFTQTAINEFSYWLQVNLNYYCKGLSFKIKLGNNSDQQHLLWISCNGNPAYFKAVTYLVDHSPNLNHWKVFAFVPKSIHQKDFYKKHQTHYPCGNYYIRLNHIFFRVKNYYKHQKQLKLNIYIKNYHHYQNKQALEEQVYAMFKDCLGEPLLFQIVHSANFFPYPKRLAINKSGLLPIYKLEEIYELLVSK